jgi:mannose-6-phosphate isomerase-like protein (cupin superfamily)
MPPPIQTDPLISRECEPFPRQWLLVVFVAYGVGYGRRCSGIRSPCEFDLCGRPEERRELITRRVVTGVNSAGKSEVVFDGNTPGYFDLAVSEFDVIWLSDSFPPELLGSDDPADVDHYVMKPPPGGIKWVVIRIPPESESDAVDRSSPEFARLMSKFDDGGVMEPGGDGWHTTQTLDLVTVISGEVDLELDDVVTRLKAGDCVVQRGTRHRWVNRGVEPCVLSGVIIAA